MHPTPDTVIWITTDHLRWDLLGAHGADWMHTPHIDRLIRDGVSFDRCFTQSPICMPSRCSFMTGCYPQQTGVMTNGQELDPAFPTTVARCFGAGGYRTVQVGKLHFQCHEDHDLDPRARHDYGFDVLQLSEEPGCYEDAYRTWLRSEHPDQVDRFTVLRASDPERLRSDARRCRVLDAPWRCSHSGWVATQAERVLRGGAGGQRGQFLHCGLYAPHPPLNPTAEMFAPYRDRVIPDPIPATHTRMAETLSAAELREYRRHFAALITGADLAVGALFDELERTGRLANTLVVFGSDHGDLCGDHGGVSKGASFYEGIMRVPWVLHWPAGLGREARRVRGLVEMVDVLPTLLGLCGLPVPPEMSGRDYSAALLAGEEPTGRPDVYAVDGPGHVMLRSEDWCYLRYRPPREPREVLYDLRADPQELHDRAADPDCRETLLALRERAFERTLDASASIKPRRMRY